MQRLDGSVRSSNTPNSLYADQVEMDYDTYRCMVVKVYYIDDQKNFTFDNKQVTYDCIVLGGRREGQIIANCKMVNYLGGQFNYHERILRPAESPFNGPGRVLPKEQKGDIVYVQFVGKTSNPIIIGLGTHMLDKDTTGAKKNDGPRWLEEYNGVNTHVNKTGEYELVRKGGTFNSAKGYFTPADRATEDGLEAPEELFQARLKFYDNIMLWEDPVSSIEFKKNEILWTHVVGKEEQVYKEVIDGTAEKTTRTYKSGIEIVEDGANDQVYFKLANGTLIDVDGAGGTITMTVDNGNNQIQINQDGNIFIKATTKVNIDAPFVDVGENAAFSSTLFENLLTEFLKHTHGIPGNVGPAVTTGPTAPYISLVGSQTVKVNP